MPIEIRQLTIKSQVLQTVPDIQEADTPIPNLEALKDTIREECKHVILDVLREREER